MRAPTDIKAIFFDLGEVLIKFDAHRACRRLAERLNCNENLIWQEAFVSGLERHYTTGRISSEDFFHQMQQRLKGQISFHEFADIWNDIFWENEGMKELVESLKKEYSLFLISNTNALHFDYLKSGYPVLKHFQRCFPSHEVGHRKPEPEIYRIALRETKAIPAQSVFIDDIPDFV